MAKIYLVRHAESIANTKGIYQGQSYNTRLSKLGRQQAQALSHRFRDTHLDFIVTSPLLRTRSTALVVAKGRNIPVVEESEIIETNHGAWEGLSKTLVAARWPRLYRRWLASPAVVHFPGGEAFADTRTRVLSWWRKALRYHGVQLVITHDNIARIIVAQVLGLPFDNIWQFHLYPAAITTIAVTDDKPTVVTLNDTRHLGECGERLANYAL